MVWRLFVKFGRPFSVHKNILRKEYKMPFYAVAKGRTPGIFMTWPDCEAQVKGFQGAKYKKFDSVVDAQEFISAGSSNNSNQKTKSSRLSLPSKNNSLKRSYSTTSQNKDDPVAKKQTKLTQNKSDIKSKGWEDSDDSDDLSAILSKQMDDIEKRLNGCQKSVDRIIKKNRKAILIEPTAVEVEKSNKEFQTDSDGYVQVYTDGACSSNGQHGARAGLGVYWGVHHPLNISAPVSGRATNNCGEIQAASQAMKIALEHGVNKLTINTDSKFLIDSVTKWMSGWKKKGWKLKSGGPVKNEIDFKELDGLQNKLLVKWNYVEAHRGIYGNEMADQLAKAGAAMYNK